MSLKRTIDKVSNVVDTDAKVEKLTKAVMLANFKDGNLNRIKPLHQFINETAKIEVEKEPDLQVNYDVNNAEEALKNRGFRADYDHIVVTNNWFFLHINLSKTRFLKDKRENAKNLIIHFEIQKKRVYDTLLQVIERGFNKLLSENSPIKIDYQFCTETEREDIKDLFEYGVLVDGTLMESNVLSFSCLSLEKIIKGECDGKLEKVLNGGKKVCVWNLREMFELVNEDDEAITSCDEDVRG